MFINGQFSLVSVKQIKVIIQNKLCASYLPNLVLQDGVGFNVDREWYTCKFEFINQPLVVAFRAKINYLEDVCARREHNLERLMVFLLAPSKLTRLVEQAVERV